jgi:hypothetical protein
MKTFSTRYVNYIFFSLFILAPPEQLESQREALFREYFCLLIKDKDFRSHVSLVERMIDGIGMDLENFDAN